MEVLPLSALPRYCDQIMEDGNRVESYLPKLSDVPPAGILRLSELADRLSASRSMTFDERIRALQVTPVNPSERNLEKILELLNTTLHHILSNDVENGKLTRDYTQFLVEYIDIVRDARGPSSPSASHATLRSRAYRAICIDARDSNAEVLETLNTMLFSTLADDQNEGGGERRTRDYSPFFAQYVLIVSDADELSPGDSKGSRDLLRRAYTVASSTLRS